ncbi:MAG: acyltransferase family protein [Candidatus Omnitrophica bacterium]|nr:acyltransferase family protein [Candidatus Omnitrophota bacterium]
MERVAWLDTAKALGIFLVILGHHKINSTILIWIYSFHMPLFFFISGYLFNPEKYPVFSSFFVKKFRTLIIPYFFFSLFSYLFWLLIVHKLSIHGLSLRMDPIKPLISIIYGIGVNGWEQPLDKALWFLLCLFVAEILFWKINSCCNRKQLPLMIIGLVILSFILSILNLPKLPWSVDVAITASVFYGIGFLYKDMVMIWMNNKNFIPSLLFLLIINLLCCSLNGITSINGNHGNFILFYISGIAGVLFLIGISKLIIVNSTIEIIGQNTLIIMGMSGISFFVLRGIIYLITKSLPMMTSEVPIFIAVAYSILQILFLIPIIHLLNKYFPFVIGRR